jgi:hypothetical protein
VKSQSLAPLKDSTPVTLAEATRLARRASKSLEQVKRQHARKAR